MLQVRSFIIALLLLISGTFCGFSQSNDDVRYDEKDLSLFYDVVTHVRDKVELPLNKLVIEIALYLLETPYVAATLEKEPEVLTINLRETDCILFVEMCTALAITAKKGHPSFEDYCEIVKNMRYRKGEVNGYASRLHYTSEWIIQNSNAGIMREITSEMGQVLDQKFSYMSSHAESYKQLANNPALVLDIAEAERYLEGQAPYYYVPQTDIPKCESNIKSGDIICFRSNVEGLDISHVALAFWDGEELKFIHASFKEKKVVIDSKTIADYAKNGIRVVRYN